MDFIKNYYNLLPEIEYVFYSFIPTISYFISVEFYKKFNQKSSKKSNKDQIYVSSKNMIKIIPGNIFAFYPLLNYYSNIDYISYKNILLGIFIIDTIQYFYHYLSHYFRFLYKNFHSYHHKPSHIAPDVSFFDHDNNILATGAIMTGGMVYMGLSFKEQLITNSLAVVSTVCDHTITSDRKFHYIHHHVDRSKNLQQPFFTFWDHIFGTYYKYSKLKIPFKP